MTLTDLKTIVAEPWDACTLIDSGNGLKYERYGPVKVVRPEPQAMWQPAKGDWDPDATFVPAATRLAAGAGSVTARSRATGRCRATA